MYSYMESIPGTLMIWMWSQTQNFRKRVRLQRRTWVTYAMRRCTRRIFHCPLQQMFWNTNLEGSTFGAWEKCFTLYSKVWEAVAQNTASLLLVFHSQPQIESLKQEWKNFNISPMRCYFNQRQWWKIINQLPSQCETPYQKHSWYPQCNQSFYYLSTWWQYFQACQWWSRAWYQR